MMAFDVTCISENDLVGCGPEPCFYQENDPNHGITGIKWDDTEVEKGETKCYDFTLEGDWTGLIHETTIGTKAATEVAQISGICGPVCFGCSSFVQVLNGDELLVSTRLTHNRPPTVTTNITLSVALLKDPSNVIAEWTEGSPTCKPRRRSARRRDRCRRGS